MCVNDFLNIKGLMNDDFSNFFNAHFLLKVNFIKNRSTIFGNLINLDFLNTYMYSAYYIICTEQITHLRHRPKNYAHRCENNTEILVLV